MSTNHYSSDHFPDAHLYCSYAHCLMESSSGNSNQKSTFFSTGGYWPAGGGGGGSSSAMFDLNNEDEEESGCDEQVNTNANHDGEGSNLMEMDQFGQDEMEPLFEKPLTPSDVGKLNRLVIPKQHAERYFPISGGGGDPGEKGFILSFEDEMGKLWRFRYSYWNSSQSYVLTKGWSRFVKDKRLDAGDFVLFSRHRADYDRLFIGWRKRNSGQGSEAAHMAHCRGDVGGGGGLGRTFFQGNPYPNQQYQGFTSQAQQDCLHAGSGSQNQIRGGGNSRRVRLFGVNLECQADESDPSTPTNGLGHAPYNQHHYYSDHQNHTGWP